MRAGLFTRVVFLRAPLDLVGFGLGFACAGFRFGAGVAGGGFLARAAGIAWVGDVARRRCADASTGGVGSGALCGSAFA